jgi:hypothetical protein
LCHTISKSCGWEVTTSRGSTQRYASSAATGLSIAARPATSCTHHKHQLRSVPFQHGAIWLLHHQQLLALSVVAIWLQHHQQQLRSAPLQQGAIWLLHHQQQLRSAPLQHGAIWLQHHQQQLRSAPLQHGGTGLSTGGIVDTIRLEATDAGTLTLVAPSKNSSEYLVRVEENSECWGVGGCGRGGGVIQNVIPDAERCWDERQAYKRSMNEGEWGRW